MKGADVWIKGERVLETKIGLLAIWTTTPSNVVWGECHLFQIDKTAPWFIVAWTCRNLFYKEHKEYKRLYCDRLREVSTFWDFFIKFLKEYLKFYTPQKLWIFFPNRCISYLSISRFYSRKWYFPLCKSRPIN